MSLQRDKLEEDGELREGQVEVLHYPQHCFRLDVGSAKPLVTRLHHFIHQYASSKLIGNSWRKLMVGRPPLLDENHAGDVVGGSP